MNEKLKEYYVKWNMLKIKIGKKKGILKDKYIKVNFVKY